MNTRTATTTRNQTVDLAQFLSYAAALIRSQGYVSGTTAKETGQDSTGTLAWTWATQGRVGEILQGIKFESYDRATGAATLEWMKKIQAQKGNQNYNYYIALIASQGKVGLRDIGYAASAVKMCELERQQKLNPTGNYLGEMGKRISLRLTLKKISGYDSQYGYTYLYKFEDAAGNCAVWSTGKHTSELGIELEGNYLVTGTVKKLDTWNGQKQTSITRCSIK